MEDSTFRALEERAQTGDPVARAVEALVTRVEKLSKSQSEARAEARERALERAKFEGGAKVVLGIIGLLGGLLGTGVVWLITTTWTTSSELPSITSDIAELRAADDGLENQVEALRTTLDSTRTLQAETNATLRAIDARLERIEARLDSERN